MAKSPVMFTAFSLMILLTALQLRGQDGSIADKIDKKSFSPSTLLWYTKAAARWEEALPVGNGRLGAMVFGKADEEIIQLNEDTYWTGGPYSTVVKGGAKVLPEIQKLVFNEEMLKAHNLFGRNLMGYPVEQQKYQSLANLHLLFEDQKPVSGYKRWLDLENGICSVTYTVNGVNYQRDVFSSAPDQVIVIRLTADKPGSITFSANLRGVRNQTHSNYATDYFRMDGYGNDALKLTGKSADYMGITGRLRYEAILKALPEGGKMTMDDATLKIENADAVTLYFVAATNFVSYKDVSADAHARVEKYLNDLSGKSYTAIKAAHIKDYKSLFDRVSLNLELIDNAYLPTDVRILKIKSSSDPQLAALCYQFGRYLLISSSRPGTQPANLQGIWNNDTNPPWDSKYTTNINTEMNYWAVESANLSECAEPLLKMVKEITDQGSAVAREHYGAHGWVLHQNTDIWRVAAPMDGPTWGTFTVGGAWLTNELWEHYLFTKDKDFVKQFYPILKGSVEFFMDFLVERPDGKWLVTNPSTSPENFPASRNNKPYFDEVTGSMIPGTTICAGSSIDMEILTDLFGNFQQASDLLGVDKDFAMKVAAAGKRLVPPQIGKDGSLQEWTDDWAQMEKNHRHFSHLYGLYPGNVLSVKRTPQFMDACKAVLNQRGDEGAGFSRAWKMSLWARLYDGNRSYKLFKGYLKDQCFPQLFAKCFTPMQVDGSLGVTAGINEMLVQSHEGVIDFLPALPDEWSEGKFDGVCVRGAFELNFEWKNGKITQASLLSKQGELCRMNPKVAVQIKSNGKRIVVKKQKDGSIEFLTQKGNRYNIEVIPPAIGRTSTPKLEQLSGGLKGYISMKMQSPPDGFGYGVSFYASAWPLLKKPLSDFQIGLPSTWIVPDNRGFKEPLCPIGTIARDNWADRGPSYRDVFQTIEGGLGFWASTQFGSPTAKFRMNGTPNCYNHEISSPGWGFGNTTALASTEMGLAQLSNHLLVPPDGLTFIPGTSGELLGNAWMALPLTEAKIKKTEGGVSTGDLNWTLFLNSTNFKGLVAFYFPQVWSRIANGYPTAEGRGLDTRAGIADGGAMEVNTVPYFEAVDSKGDRYSKIPRLQFPVNKEGNSVLMQDVTMYSMDALYQPLKSWFSGGKIVSGEFDALGSYAVKCSTAPITLKQGPKNRRLSGIDPVVETRMLGQSSFGLAWKKAKKMGYFPEYYRQEGDKMIAISSSEVPAETHLKEQSFSPAKNGRPYASPDNQGTVWATPGPQSGPYTARLSDGSVVTYSWYRFVDQPSLQALKLSAEEKERLQRIVEFIHVNWTINKEYMPPPTQGKTATLDQALLVTPPKGLEIGYVPIVTRQAAGQ